MSPGYLQNANCQFPRAMRAAGRRYLVPRSAIALTRTGDPTKHFYRVKDLRKSEIKICEAEEGAEEGTEKGAARTILSAVYGDEDGDECIVCMANERSQVFAPCGHFCCCGNCARTIQRTGVPCPLCRTDITLLVKRDDVVLV